jgi:hypothetical protein
MARLYLEQQVVINIYIDKNDIDATDTINVYETTIEPAGEIIATVKSIETETDPSSTGDAYLFVVKKRVIEPKNYSFFYTVVDSAGNESASVNVFDIDVCLTPLAPLQIPPDDIIFIEDPYNETDLAAHYKMDDDDDSSNIINEVFLDPPGTYSNFVDTENRTTDGAIGTALIFSGDPDYIDTNLTFQSIFQDSFSVNIWVKPDEGQPSGPQTIMGASDDSSESEVRLFLEGSELGFVYISDGMEIGAGANNVFPVGPASDFRMITVIVEHIPDVGGDDASINIYIDGVYSDSDSDEMTMIDYASIHNVFFGALNDGGTDTQHFEGDIDDVSIFNRVLTEDDIGYLYSLKDTPTPEFYNTVYHFPSDTPASITNDGDFDIGTETYYLFTPSPDGEYQYYRTTTDEDCQLESDGSVTTPILIVGGEVNNIPLSDPFNLFLNNAIDGSFIFLWNYNATSNDPVNKWRIYHNILSNPSDESENWILEDTTDMVFSQTNLFSYVTTTNPDGEFVEFKVVPVYFDGVDYFERDNNITVLGTADAQSPVVVSDFIDITLE